MKYTLLFLFKHANESQTEINGNWVPARPCSAGWKYRIASAWSVLTGKADAFTWPEGQ